MTEDNLTNIEVSLVHMTQLMNDFLWWWWWWHCWNFTLHV